MDRHAMTFLTSLIRCAAAVAMLGVTAACSVPFTRKDTAVRVLVYNIHAGKDTAGQPNLTDVGALVQSIDADIVLLQEVDRGTKRSGGVDQLQALMDATKYAGVFGRTLDYEGGQYGIAALSRDGFGFSATIHLPVTPPQARAGGSREPRGALLATARTRLGRWQLMTTHLDASGGDEYRQQEVDQLREILRRRLAAGLPLLIGGDFNATPDSAVIRKWLGYGVRDAWAECGEGDGFTFPAAKPIKRIDYLFLTGSLKCTAARVIETTISDHRPVLFTIVVAGGS